MINRNILNRHAQAGDLLENFLIAAISTILIIRFYLSLTGFPQLGGGSIHIAHMLWGGILLLFAIVLTLSFIGNNILRIAAIIGGIGFGTFIDELGKFITSDNNYFFEPTIALLYILFLILFFTFRFIENYKPLTEKEYLLNALRLLEEEVIENMDENEKKTLLLYLKQANTDAELTKRLKALARSIEAIPLQKPNKLQILYIKSKHFFEKIIKSTIV